MNDENEMNDREEQESSAGMSQAVPESGRDEIAAGAAPDTGVDAGPPPQAAVNPNGGEAGTARSGSKRYFSEHKVLAGAVVGVLSVLIAAGIFLAGYYVGKPGDKRAPKPVMEQLQPFGPGPQQQPDLRSTPTPGRKGAMGGLGILDEYREEIEGGIATELGISTTDLQDEMESGKTIAEIAEERDVSVDELTGVVAAKINEIADRLAADGEITASRAEEIKSDSETIASRLIERGWRRAPNTSGGDRG